jgi:hypothetical protein
MTAKFVGRFFEILVDKRTNRLSAPVAGALGTGTFPLPRSEKPLRHNFKPIKFAPKKVSPDGPSEYIQLNYGAH